MSEFQKRMLAGAIGTIVLILLGTILFGCTTNNHPNLVDYRGADTSSAVVHWGKSDPPGIWHDLFPPKGGGPSRTWQELVIYVNGRPQRIFQEISVPQTSRDGAVLHHKTPAPRCVPACDAWFPDWPIEDRGPWSWTWDTALRQHSPTLAPIGSLTNAGRLQAV